MQREKKVKMDLMLHNVPIPEIQKEGTQNLGKIEAALARTLVNLRNDLRQVHHGEFFCV